MGGWGIMIPNPQLLTKLSEGCIVKLASVVWDEHPRNFEAKNYVLLDEIFDISFSDSCQGLCFHPFGKVINPYYQEPHLSCPYGEGTKDVKSPLGKGPRGHHWSKIHWWLPRYIVVSLTLIACFNISFSIYLHRRPIISCADYFIDEGPRSEERRVGKECW